MVTKPMLAESIFDETRQHTPDEVYAVLQRLRYPLLITPKLDGIRTLMLHGKAVSRSLKPVPNKYTRELMQEELPHGLDGEFYIEGETFNNISGAWRNAKGKPEFSYCVFDYVPESLGVPYHYRMDQLRALELPPYCVKLLPVSVGSPDELLVCEAEILAQGYEGVMLRDPGGPYKCGRSTLREGWLLKFKRFNDAEARVVGFQELYRNKNEPVKNALGRTERSTHKENMVPAGTLGALLVEGVTAFPGVRFSIGTGLDVPTRNRIWDAQESYLGKIVTFAYQDIGVKDAPRFPKFRGFRSTSDL